MPSEHQLSNVLSEFASTLVTDFPIQAILDHLVQRIVDVLPITAAGVTLISPEADPRYVAASDASALRFEELQTELGEGPCLAAYHGLGSRGTVDGVGFTRTCGCGEPRRHVRVGGTVTTDFMGHTDIAYPMALQADGKIVVAGESGLGGSKPKFALVRYNDDGSLDTTFGGDGKVTTDFSPDEDVAYSVAIQSDGKTVAAGTSGTRSSP